jgi:hypothetical protein
MFNIGIEKRKNHRNIQADPSVRHCFIDVWIKFG